ncbi:pyrophosphate-dependent fructose-1,6-bisphosphatase [Emiliania huxleyi CCMP1516]|uniref:Phosphofructokinase domain-containing protein n=2 Tax=Emiliania huxleyi TaxID=2903 RepID=A0A0D3I3X8_EMIH1|nr:pyrophosphate-dependent fructose-1,6-bisphosphatase [Emiliania huxleyi CCMP1516]EOD05963.1 pyrophosphate-dependent fructose-1,6-bisphosphatase [Emiliania huxleyi CCMP1516]|eukprot:XP_005758392.1 pyrophosphate-dependent fructose-1,6-bisphosphatase [Emiliania huxleyi CCMP1516]
MVKSEDFTQPMDAEADVRSPKKVAMLTAGGLAPCLSSAVGALITEYAVQHPTTELICYINGYKGLLLGESIKVCPAIRATAAALHQHGGSPIGNSRVKLTNIKDCLKRGLVKEGQDPQQVAADQLIADGVEVLHTIGGDDTNTAAADLAAFLQRRSGYAIRVIGLPKTIDNDVFPITQSLGAWTAAEEGARFFENVGAEATANPRMMIVHEVMGRDCGWLTAATAHKYRERLWKRPLLPHIGLHRGRLDVHAVYIPELQVDIDAEAARLKKILDEHDNVNIFISEGAGVKDIVAKMEADGKEVQRDAFGHVKLDSINPGKYFADTFSALIGAEKVLVQKSGYYARAAKANEADIDLIARSAKLAVQCACEGVSGVVALDEDAGDVLRCIEFPRIAGGKHFNTEREWFQQMLREIGQTGGAGPYPVNH